MGFYCRSRVPVILCWAVERWQALTTVDRLCEYVLHYEQVYHRNLLDQLSLAIVEQQHRRRETEMYVLCTDASHPGSGNLSGLPQLLMCSSPASFWCDRIYGPPGITRHCRVISEESELILFSYLILVSYGARRSCVFFRKNWGEHVFEVSYVTSTVTPMKFWSLCCTMEYTGGSSRYCTLQVLTDTARSVRCIVTDLAETVVVGRYIQIEAEIWTGSRPVRRLWSTKNC